MVPPLPFSSDRQPGMDVNVFAQVLQVKHIVEFNFEELNVGGMTLHRIDQDLLADTSKMLAPRSSQSRAAGLVPAF